MISQDDLRPLGYSQPMNDNIPDKILDSMLKQVPFEGWTTRALTQALKSLDLPKGSAELYVPGGASSLIGQWSARKDKDMLERFEVLDKSELRIRDKVKQAVWFRLEAIGRHEEAAKRATSRLALPDMAGEGAALLWASADKIWAALGDKSEDYNYYTKRLTLSAVLGSSVLSYLADDTEDKSKARAFLDKRIENVMRFESIKGKIRDITKSETGGFNPLKGGPKPSEILDMLQSGPMKGPRRRRSWRYYR